MKLLLNKANKQIVKIKKNESQKSLLFSLIALILSTIIAILTAASYRNGPTTIDRIFDIFVGVSVNIAMFILFAVIISFIISFIAYSFPYMTTATLIYNGLFWGVVLFATKSGLAFSIIIGLSVIVINIISGLILTKLLIPFSTQKALQGIAITCLLIAGWQINSFWNSRAITAVNLQNYTHFGNYNSKFFTYGSGNDRQRSEFNKEVAIKTNSIDATNLITYWPEKRTKFWGFSEQNLPINGRVFMPEGKGPFPVILMVHGNHIMENFSTAGYDYLGEVLASNGFIFISVDEDFINYSNISSQPNDNYKLRAWLLLQHLSQLKEMNENNNNYFYNKIDFNNVALAGHSRGGQAAAIAADYHSFFDDQQLINTMEDITIKGVAAISPTDRQIDKKRPILKNVAYLVLHGASDADVFNFRGRGQYYRTHLATNSNLLKSTVYIQDANHVKFNTSWGNRDLSYPKGLFLNQHSVLKNVEQQLIAQIYLTAYFQQIFNNTKDYEQLINNNSQLANLLPKTNIVESYNHSSYRPLVKYRDRRDLTGEFTHFNKKRVTRAKNRSGNYYPNNALLLAWEKDASYSFTVPANNLLLMPTKQNNKLVISIANLKQGTTTEVELVAKTRKETITLGKTTLSPAINIDTTIFGLFDNVFRSGRYKQKSEPIFETIEFSLSELDYEDLKTGELQLNFYGEDNEIMIEEIGIY